MGNFKQNKSVPPVLVPGFDLGFGEIQQLCHAPAIRHGQVLLGTESPLEERQLGVSKRGASPTRFLCRAEHLDAVHDLAFPHHRQVGALLVANEIVAARVACVRVHARHAALRADGRRRVIVVVFGRNRILVLFLCVIILNKKIPLISAFPLLLLSTSKNNNSSLVD